MPSWFPRLSRPRRATPRLSSTRAAQHGFSIEPLEIRALLSVTPIHISLTGDDGTGDGSAAMPYRTIAKGIAEAATAADGNDTILIAGGTYNSAVDDLGFTIPNDANIQALLIEGGWDTTFTTHDPGATPTDYLPQDAGGQITIADAGATLKDINFTLDGTADGIVVSANDTSLTSLSVTNALDGVAASAVSNLTINGVNSSSNLDDGFDLSAVTGTLSLGAVTADGNAGNGVKVTASSMITVTGGSYSNNTAGDGLELSSTGSVSITSATASDNGANGIEVLSATSLSSASVTANSNGMSGLRSTVVMPVTITGGSYNSNTGGDGIHLPSVTTLTITGPTAASSNTGDGIEVGATGAVSLGAVTADGNAGNGAKVTASSMITVTGGSYSNNTAGDGLELSSTGSVSITSATANDNGANGIEVLSATSLSSSSVTANNNSTNGMKATVSGPITISGGSYSSNTLDSGLLLSATGSVSITSATANSNGAHGIRFFSAASSLDSVSVTASGNAGYGLDAIVTGDTTITAGSYDSNGADGIQLNVTTGDISITGGTTANDNGVNGIRITATGDVTITSATANSNGNGIRILSAASLSASTVTADGNVVDGLNANVSGPITITGGSYSSNPFGTGLLLSATGSVSITSATANSNGIRGIRIVSAASLSASTVTADGNADGMNATVSGPITITGGSYSSNTADNGLLLSATGSVSITSATANSNGGYGIRILSTTSLSASTVTADGNAIDGLSAFVSGPVTISGGSYSNNVLGHGVHLDTTGATTLSGFTANGNGDNGFEVDSVTTLTIEDLTLKTNGGFGGVIDGTPTVVYRPSTSTAADAVELTNNQLRHARAGDAQQPIFYNLVTTMTIDTRAGNDTITISGNPSGIPVATLALLAGDDHDTILVTEPTADLSPFPVTFHIFGEGGNDGLEVNLGRAAVPTTLSFDGGAGMNGLSVFTRSAASDTVTIDGAKIVAMVPATKTINYTSVFGVNAAAGDGHDTFIINEPVSGAFPSLVGVYGQGGEDGIEVNLGRHNTATTFNVFGGDLRNGLTVFTRNALDDLVVMSEGLISAGLKVINFADLVGVNLYTSGGNDTVSVTQPAVGVFPIITNVNTEAGDDSISVRLGLPSFISWISVDAGTGVDDRLAVTTASGHADIVDVNSTRVLAQLGPNAVAAASKPVFYQGIDLLNVASAGGGDTITLSREAASPALPVVVNLDGQDEDDTIVLNLRNIPTGVNIVAEGGAGDDLITANLTGAPVAPDVRARGGAGNDKFAVKDVLGNSADISVANESSGARLTVDPATIECVQYYGFDGNDQMTHLATTRSFMDGGAGDDTLTGGAMRDLLFGGDGVDSLLGNAGDDFLFADINGQGVETVRDGDFVNGGPGLDTVATRGIDNIDGFTTDESEFTQQEGANFDVVFWLTADFKATTFNAAKTAELLADALSKDCAQKLDFTPAP